MSVLFRSEDAVSRVAEGGHDVAVLVERRVRVMGDVNFDVRMGFDDASDPLGRGDQGEQFDVFESLVFDKAGSTTMTCPSLQSLGSLQ